MMNDDINKKVEILTLERFGRAFTFVIVVGIIVLLVLEIFTHRHGEFAIEDIFFFPAIFGFVAFVFVVMFGTFLRRFIMRDEDYYTKREGGNDDT